MKDYRWFSENPDYREAYDYGYDDAKREATTGIKHLLVWLLIFTTVIAFSAGNFIASHAQSSKDKKHDKINDRYSRLVSATPTSGESKSETKEAVASCSATVLEASESQAKHIPVEDWYRKSDNAFILRNVKHGPMRIEHCFFQDKLLGVDPKSTAAELIIEDGKEIQMNVVEDDAIDVLVFEFLNERYEIVVNTEYNWLAKIIGWKQDVDTPRCPPERSHCGYPNSLFWADASFWKKTTYARIKLGESKHTATVYRNKDNRICVKFKLHNDNG